MKSCDGFVQSSGYLRAKQCERFPKRVRSKFSVTCLGTLPASSSACEMCLVSSLEPQTATSTSHVNCNPYSFHFPSLEMFGNLCPLIFFLEKLNEYPWVGLCVFVCLFVYNQATQPGIPSKCLAFTDFNEFLLYVQFIEADLRQKLEHAKEISDEAKGTLKDFRTQSTQVEKFINDVTTWLTKLEESLANCAQTETCEGLKKVKVGNKLS